MIHLSKEMQVIATLSHLLNSKLLFHFSSLMHLFVHNSFQKVLLIPNFPDTSYQAHSLSSCNTTNNLNLSRPLVQTTTLFTQITFQCSPHLMLLFHLLCILHPFHIHHLFCQCHTYFFTLPLTRISLMPINMPHATYLTCALFTSLNFPCSLSTL